MVKNVADIVERFWCIVISIIFIVILFVFREHRKKIKERDDCLKKERRRNVKTDC